MDGVFGLSEGGRFPLMWVVSAAKLKPPFSSSALRPLHLHGHPGRSGSGSTRSINRQPLFLSLSRPHLTYDEAHALHHGDACSESTSASLRPEVLWPFFAFVMLPSLGSRLPLLGALLEAASSVSLKKKTGRNFRREGSFGGFRHLWFCELLEDLVSSDPTILDTPPSGACE